MLRSEVVSRLLRVRKVVVRNRYVLRLDIAERKIKKLGRYGAVKRAFDRILSEIDTSLEDVLNGAE